MGASSIIFVPSARDFEILAALDRCPLTVLQILKLSTSFAVPLTTVRRVQERMQLLSERGLVHTWQYAVPGQGTMNYYTLSREGCRTLRGLDGSLPGHRAFEPLSLVRLIHTQALAEVIVHTAVAAKRSGFLLDDFNREGSLQLQVGEDFLYPDSAFCLTTPSGSRFPFYVELDNRTESVGTAGGDGPFEQKIRFYEALKDHRKAHGHEHRFRVALVTTGTEVRLRHLLDRTAQLLRLKNRSFVFGITLADFLDADDPLTTDCFRDNCGQMRALVAPGHTVPNAAAEPARRSLAALAAV